MTEQNEWPLWECLSGESIAALMKYQWTKYGTHLDIADRIRQARPSLYHPEPDIDELDKIMRGKPRGKGR